MAIMKTDVGTVDARMFEKLSEDFDTRRLTTGMNTLTAIRSQVTEIDDWQKRLTRLHRMAMYLINEDDFTGPTGDEPIWEVARELADEIWDWKEGIDELYEALDELSDLAPDPDDTDECQADHGGKVEGMTEESLCQQDFERRANK